MVRVVMLGFFVVSNDCRRMCGDELSTRQNKRWAPFHETYG
jgi:hypothetical protein